MAERLNQTEIKAQRWLEKQGYSGIVFQGRNSPDFLTDQGIGFEVKKLREHTITFSKHQWNQLQQHPEVKILVYNEGDEPEAIIPLGSLHTPPSYWRNYRLSMVDLTAGRYAARGEKLRGQRERLGLTQEKLAQRLGVSCYTVRRWETGKVKPSPLAQKAIDNLLREERDATKI